MWLVITVSDHPGLYSDPTRTETSTRCCSRGQPWQDPQAIDKWLFHSWHGSPPSGLLALSLRRWPSIKKTHLLLQLRNVATSPSVCWACTFGMKHPQSTLYGLWWLSSSNLRSFPWWLKSYRRWMLDVRCLTSVRVGMTKKTTYFPWPARVEGCHAGSKARRNIFSWV